LGRPHSLHVGTIERRTPSSNDNVNGTPETRAMKMVRVLQSLP
jgi:hypothetical protein